MEIMANALDDARQPSATAWWLGSAGIDLVHYEQDGKKISGFGVLGVVLSTE